MDNHHTLIASVANGDKSAFSKLYQEFSERVFNTALAYTKNIEEAEEVTQDVFTKLFLKASQFKGDASVYTWVYRMTVNTSLNYIKKHRKFSLFSFKSIKGHTSDFLHPGIALENQEKSKALFQAIDKLPDTQKTAFILSYVEQLPRQEVADVMETSLKAVESLLQRGKKKMRVILGDMYHQL